MFTPEEVRAVLQQMSGVHQLICNILYGSGLRLQEAVQLGIKGLDFSQAQIVVRDAKGQESRVTMLPSIVQTALQEHLQQVKRIHQQDSEQGYGAVALPLALARKDRTLLISLASTTESFVTLRKVMCATNLNYRF